MSRTRQPRLLLALLLAVLLALPAACGEDGADSAGDAAAADAGDAGSASDAAAGGDAADDAADDAGPRPDTRADAAVPPDGSGPDAGADTGAPDTAADVPPDVAPDLAEAPDTGDVGDTGDDGADVPLPPLPLGPTAEAPADPLAGSAVASCPVYQEERCVDGARERCAIYDTATEAFVAEPDPTLRRAYLYDRWYDLYESPGGLTAERVFRGPMPGDAPEEVWGDPANFLTWAGKGDAAIWTGAALTADAFRYLVTGTEADYQRMEDKTRDLLRAFDVTGVPGYVARFHYLLVPPGTPERDDLMMIAATPESLGNSDNVIEDTDIEGLPAAYVEGVPDGQGGVVHGTPMWNGHLSIDQYTGPMVSFPVVWPLLRNPELRSRIVWHMTCYLKRLRRIDIVHLQQNPQIRDAVLQYLGASGLRLDPDDIDLAAIDRVAVYYHAGLNPANRETFDRTCPDTVATEPGRVLDATAPNFLLQMLEFAQDLTEDDTKPPRPNQIDHVYVPSLRGGDASHLLHLAAMAYWFTGDEQYRRFLYETLVDDLQADRVALTAQAFRLPDWCHSFYGDHISYNTHWQFLTMLRDSPLRDTMVRVMHEEFWQKALHHHHSAFFDVAYASTVPADVFEGGAAGRDAVIARAVRQLEHFGGNGGTLDAPRRTHDLPPGDVIAALPEGVTVRCPSEDERAACEEGGTVFGIPLEGETISYPCDGRTGECVMADGLCVEGLASEGLPIELRQYADFQWQRSPFQLGERFAVDGHKQSPGRDLSEPYWMARYYGFLTDGAGQVLAWQPIGACE